MDESRADDPRQVGRYTLLARLGSGGMGQVYYGRSPGGRHVAVKVIRADLAQDQSFRARFAREVEAARRVSGAFTAPVIDADPDAPVPWLVTDYVHGPSLGDAVTRHGALPAPALLTLAARLAEGLGAVHAAGVIHRDLKPANVLLAEDGPRLIDFGISQAADFAQITSPTSVLGTPGFIAPELVQGRPVGPASDVFTMGAVLAYAATGEYPFGTGPADARTLRVLYLAPDLDKVPGGLRPLLERCLAKDPAERPTPGGFLTSLVAACPEAASGRDDWLPDGILAEIRQRPLPPQETAASSLRITVPPPAAAGPSGTSLQRPRTGKNRRIRAAVAAVAVAVLGTVAALLAAPSGDPSAAAPAAAGVGFDWTGITNFKETFSSDNAFKQVGSTWSDQWSFHTDCVLQSCGVTLVGVIGGNPYFAATLSRHGLTYSGNVAINDYWICSSDNKPMDSKLYITLTGQSTAGPNGPGISSFTGVLNWRVAAEGKCGPAAEYDMQVQSGASV